MDNMKKYSMLMFTVVLLSLVLAACGGGSGGGSGAEAGKALFDQSVIGTNAGCITCHSLEKDVTIVGPSLAGIATKAGSIVPGKSAEEYLRESIIDPNAYIHEGFTANVMPQNWSEVLTEEQINQLVDYLMTLK